MRQIQLSNYSVYLGDLKESFPKALSIDNYSAVYVLVDELTEKHCLDHLKPLLGEFSLIKIASGESNKNIQGASLIWQHLIDHQADRKALLINLGGGVIGDMGGLCASTFKRGIDFIQVPTTLLAQVDASIGGKLAIDFDQIKNCIGLFNDPVSILVDPIFLSTLPDRQLISGMTEILKHGLLADRSILDKLYQMESINQLVDDQLIYDAIQVKKRVVEKDPFEKGFRKVLNLGHTIGHAIESFYLESDQPLLHGEAIAIGLICEIYLSHHLLGMDKNVLDQLDEFVQKWYASIFISPSNYAEIFHLLLNDKKNEHGKIYFSLLEQIEKPLINQEVSKDWILKSFDFYNEKATTNA
jgi:3-dehydroquinate synthase